MHTDAREGSPEIPLIDPRMTKPAAASEPWPERRCASPLLTQAVLCAIAIITSLLLITAAADGIPATGGPVFPAVCLPGLLRSGRPSRLKRWLKRGQKESENEEEKPHLPATAPPGAETEPYPADSLFPGEIEIEWPGEDLEEFKPPTEAAPAEGEASPEDLSIESSSISIADEPPASRSESLSDDDLIRMLGFEEGDLGPALDELEPAGIGLQDDRPVESLIEDLMSDDGMVRRRAVEAVAERGADAVDPLIHALAQADKSRRWCIADALAMVGEDAIPALVAALGDDEAQIGAATTLVRMGGPAVPPLIQALADDDEEVRFGARYALREIGDEALPSLIEALDAPERRIRNTAAAILRDLGWTPPDTAASIRCLIAEEAWLDLAAYGETAIEPLIQILRSRDKGLWWNAARTLGEIGEAAIGPLIDLMQQADDEVRPLAAMALAEIGAAGIDPLIRMLENPDIRSTAAEALVRIGEPAAEACIQSLNTADGEIESALREILCAIGDPAIPGLIQALIAGPQRLRSRVADILGEMGWEPWSDAERACYLISREEWTEVALMGSAAVEPLIRALNDDDGRVRREAAATLGEIGDPAAVGPLVASLADKSVAPAAAEALAAIGEPAVSPVLALLDEGGSDTAMESAVEVLGRLGEPAAVPHLIEFLRRGRDRLHRKAIDALAGIGEPAADAIIPLLGEEREAQAGAMAALAGIGGPAIPALVKALENENSAVRLGAAGVLERLGWKPADPEEEIAWLIALQRWQEVAEAGGTAINHLAARLGDPDAAVQTSVMEVLVEIGAPAAPPLVSLLGEERLREPAEDALVRIGGSAVDTLIEALHRPQIRRTAAGVLVRIGEPATGALVQALADPDTGDTVAAILEAIGEPAIDALIAALGHENACVRERALGVLAALGESAAPGLIGALDHP
ncbi:MAG TPA: HEAT repeat domain-containing protein, partial [Methanoculleus sp.]|nr:HEAT repeat domain-containing protein [Methanoculleus sp.]